MTKQSRAKLNYSCTDILHKQCKGPSIGFEILINSGRFRYPG